MFIFSIEPLIGGLIREGQNQENQLYRPIEPLIGGLRLIVDFNFIDIEHFY